MERMTAGREDEARPAHIGIGTARKTLDLMLGEASWHIRRQFALALALVIAGALLAALAPLALKWLVDTVAPVTPAGGTPQASPAALIACYVAALCGSRVLAELRSLIAGTAEQRLSASLNRHFFGHLLALPLAFHLERRAGAVAHSLYQATAGCQIIVGTILTTMVPVIVETVAVIAIMLRVDQPLLVAIFAVTALAYLIAFGIAEQPYRRRARDLSTATLELHAVLSDNLVNVETIKSFGAEPAARARFAKATADLEARSTALHRQRALIGLAIAAILAVSVTASLMVSVHAVSDGTLTLGGFVMANAYMLQIVRPLEMAGSALRDLSQAVEFVRPLLDLLDRPAESAPHRPPSHGADARRPTPNADDAVAAPSHPPEIRFDQLSFAYVDGRPALDGVNLRVPPGRSVAIVGTSGSGKSTLARLLLSLYRARAGAISLDGTPVDAIPLAQLRAMIGVVSQDTVLFNDTIAFNIAMGDQKTPRNNIEAAARLAQLHDFIMSTPAGYETLVGERGLKLSGGERQRLAIARAVLRRPSIYIFDEATSMLDSETEAALLSNLRTVSAGCTTITIAHRLSTVRDADEIVVLADGRIAERGRHAELLAKGGEYARLWRMQAGATAT
jgi:ABC-type multidrug transport system fused ATPase/permease subunit